MLNQDPKNLISATVNRRRTAILVDTGAAVSCLSRRFVDKIGAVLSKNENLEKLTTADGRNLRIQGSVEVTVGLRGLLVPHQFYVIEGLNHNALIGLDFLHVTDCKLDLRSAMVSFFGGLVVLPLQEKARDSAVLRTSACYVIPPHSEGLLPVRVSENFAARLSGVALVEPHAAMVQNSCLVAKAVVHHKTANRQTLCRVINPTDKTCTLRKNFPLATISVVERLIDNKTNCADKSPCKSQDKNLTTEEKEKFLVDMGLTLNRKNVTEDIFHKFCDLLYDYRDIFALSMKDLTGTNIIECPILTYPDAKPFRARPYKLNDEMRKEVDSQIDQMLEAGIIAESDGSQFACPIIMAKKSSGEWRFCADMRRLNSISVALYHELPLIDDVVDVMARNKVKIMSSLDFRAAYHQVRVRPDTTDKLTFVTPHRGAYKYLRLAMGHCQSPYYMSVALNKLFRFQIGTFLVVYLDDLLCCSDSPETHLGHLKIVFDKLRQAQLKLHPKKCQFLLDELKFLGHIFSSQGVRADPRKTAIVRNYPQPKCVKDVRSFLGMANYFRRLIPNYADKAQGLTKLLRKDSIFKWGVEQETSFRELKDALCNPPVLALPDPTQEMILTTDASDTSISFNLSQVVAGKERIIEYGARGLRVPEKLYSVSEKELLAIITGVNHYHDYLGGGKEFLIKTDNIALKYLNSMKHATGRLGRWNLLLSGYNYRVEHTKGQDNVVADRLSRIQLPAPETGLEVQVDEMLMNVNKAEAAGTEQIGELWEISIDANTDDDQALNGHTQDVDDTQLDLMTKYNVAEMQENCPDCQPILRFFERRYFA